MEEEARNQLETKKKLAEPKQKQLLFMKRFPREEVKLAALAISFNVRLRSSDMPVHMLEHALRCARSFVDSSPQQRPNNTLFARSLKKEFDSLYGPAWHCVVGTSFGSFVTHSTGGFVYFSADTLSVLLFKTEVHLVIEPENRIGLEQ